MKGLKTYRHKSNSQEKEFHDKFIKQHADNDMSMIVFPPNGDGLSPSEYLSRREESIVITTIQWLGSPVGQGFLRECGFVKEEK
jgi:hypothetical protein